MATHNPKEHKIENGVVVLCSKHLGEVLDVNINKAKRRFYGIKLDGTLIEHEGDCGNDFAQPVMLYKIFYCFETDTWGVNYRIDKQPVSKRGFKTAREAWLYREALIAGGYATK